MAAGARADFYVLQSADRRTRLLTACRIAEKAFEQGLRVSILAEGPEEVAELDDLLWTFSDRSFVPHGCWPAEEDFARDTPVLIGCGSVPRSHRDVLINLGQELADDPAGYARICEVVGGAEPEKKTARERWRRYRDAGLELDSHDV